MRKERTIDKLKLNGGKLCFDFINTVSDRKKADYHDYLSTCQEFIFWSEKVELLNGNDVFRLSTYVSKNQKESETARLKIVKTRENLYQLFSAIAADDLMAVKQEVILNFNAGVGEALAHVHFFIKDNLLQQTIKTKSKPLLEPLWMILKSAYHLLEEVNYKRIKECPACGWIFLDHTKNKRRRWCNSSTCGSIEKSRKYYHNKVKHKKKLIPEK